MRALTFLAVNATYSHTNLAEWYLREYADPAVWRWHSVETVLTDDVYGVTGRIEALRPDALAASLYLFNRAFVLSVLRRYRALHPECIVIGGGPECLGDNRALVAPTGCFDAVIRGEGERAWAALLRRIDDCCAWRAIPGVCCAPSGAYHDGGLAEPEPELDAIPSPYARRLPGLRTAFVQLETSRGCANTCAFCTSGRSGGTRLFSLARVRSDLEAIRSHGVRQVRIVDRTFNERPARCAALLRMFRDDFPEIDFHIEIDPARLTPTVLKELAAGTASVPSPCSGDSPCCRGAANQIGEAVASPPAHRRRWHVEAGVQCLNEAVYKIIGRRATARRTLRGTARLCALRGAATHVDLIAGLPGATLDDLRGDLECLVRLRPAELQLELLKVLPGTVLDAQCGRWGIAAAPEPPYEVLRTPTMSHADLQTARGFSRLVDWFYNPAALREAIVQASAGLPRFWDQLLAFVAARHTAPAAPNIESRFWWLDDFFQEQGSPLSQTVRYAWFKEGFSAAHGPCPSLPWRGALPPEAELVEGDAARPRARAVRAALAEDYIFVFPAGAGAGRAACAIYRLPRRS